MDLAGVCEVVSRLGAGKGAWKRLLRVLLLVVLLLCQSPLYVVAAAHSYKNVLTQEV